MKTFKNAKIFFLTLLSSSLLILPQSVFAIETDLTKALVLCKFQKTVRTVRVVVDEEKSCKAIYTKQGVDDLIGSGQHQQSCLGIVSNVRKNLEEAGWKCRDVKEARSSQIRTVE